MLTMTSIRERADRAGSPWPPHARSEGKPYGGPGGVFFVVSWPIAGRARRWAIVEFKPVSGALRYVPGYDACRARGVAKRVARSLAQRVLVFA